MSGDVITTIRDFIREYQWVAVPISLLLSILAVFLASGWGTRGIIRTVLLTRKRQLKSLRKLQGRLKHLHDTGGGCEWLLSGIFWVLFLFGMQLTLEASVASQLPTSSPLVQELLRGLLNLARFSVGYISMLVSVNRLTWYHRLEHYGTAMPSLDDAIIKLVAKQASHQSPAAV
jgi:hypothetical protein